MKQLFLVACVNTNYKYWHAWMIWEKFKLGATFCILGVLVLFPKQYTRHMDCLLSVVKNHSVTIEECYFFQSLSRLGKIIGPDIGKSLSNWHVPG